jgi:hypothetical protein
MAVTVVETVLFSVQAGRLAFRVRRERLARRIAWPHVRFARSPLGRRLDDHPDALARRLAGLERAGLLHSTSWRFEDGAVVLTYAAVPDPAPLGATPLEPERGVPYPMDPLAPGAVRLTGHDVAAHAARHLSYLRRTDPLVAETDAPADLWEAIGRCEPALAGVLGGAPITVLT